MTLLRIITDIIGQEAWEGQLLEHLYVGSLEKIRQDQNLSEIQKAKKKGTITNF